MTPPTAEELTQLHVHVEDILIMMRDSRISELTCANGLVVREADGKPSEIIRIGTRWACEMIVKKFLEIREHHTNGTTVTKE
jgi:hypothetical protein